jgi:hypothetical protein
MFEAEYIRNKITRAKAEAFEPFRREVSSRAEHSMPKSGPQDARGQLLDLTWLNSAVDEIVMRVFRQYLEYCRDEKVDPAEHLDIPHDASKKLIEDATDNVRGVWSVRVERTGQLNPTELKALFRVQRHALTYRLGVHMADAKRGRLHGDLVYQHTPPPPQPSFLERVNRHPVVTFALAVAAIIGTVAAVLALFG